jgi:5-methyltetrahydrofolate--homocysteine methyltransferase
MDELVRSVVALNEKEVHALTDQLLGDGASPMVVLDAYRQGMVEVGRLFEKEEYFLPELIHAGELLRMAAEKIKPLLGKADGGGAKRGKAVIGTVEGDIHDIGKDIVILMLSVNGYDVVDLGVDVPIKKFVEAAEDFQPHVIGLSGFLTSTYDPMKFTIEALDDRGLRDGIKIMIGGGQMDNQICEYVGADAYGKDAIQAVTFCDQWLHGTR